MSTSTRILIVLAVTALVLVCSQNKGATEGRRGSAPVPFVVDDSNLSMSSVADVPTKRRQIIQFLWGPGGFPTQQTSSVRPNVANPLGIPISNIARIDQLNFVLGEGIRNAAFHFVPANSNGKLVIVHQGHDPLWLDNGTRTTIAALVEDGYGVLAAAMPCFNFGVTREDGACDGIPDGLSNLYPGAAHNQMFAQLHPTSGHVYKYFVEHLARALNYFQANFPGYTEFDMVGLSGGGWTTVLYAAIDPRIKTSFSVSGTKPMYLKRCSNLDGGCLNAGDGVGYDGDREQMDPALYSIAGYLDLYALAAAGAGRRHIQVQIRWDVSVFGQNQYATGADGHHSPRPSFGAAAGLTWNQAVRAYEARVQQFLSANTDQGWFRYEIDETLANTPAFTWSCGTTLPDSSCTTPHSITTSTRIQVILADLDGDRRPFAAASTSDIYLKGLDGTLRHSPPWWPRAPVNDIVGTPSVVESGGTTDVFSRDESSGLIQLHVAGGWSTTVRWAGILASDPAAALVNGVLHVVAVSTDGRLWHWGPGYVDRVDGTTEVVGTPVLLSAGANQLDAFVRRPDGRLQHMYWRGSGAWSTETLPGIFRGFPTAVATSDARRVFARGLDNKLYEISQPRSGGAWFLARLADYAGVPGVRISGSPSASIIPGSGQPYVANRSPSGRLAVYQISGGTWHYDLISPPFRSMLSLCPVAVPGGVYGRAVDRSVWLYSTSSGSWQRRMGQID